MGRRPGMKATAFGLLLPLAGLAVATTTIPVDQIGVVGRQNAIAIGADGYPAVSYLQQGTVQATSNLRFTKCGSVDCLTGNTTADIALGDVFANLSLVVTSDGRPVLAYLQAVSGNLVARVTKCGNASCSAGNVTRALPGTPILAQSNLYSTVPGGIAVGSDDRPIVVFAQSGSLRIVKCADPACSSVSSVVAPLPGVSSARIAIGPDGRPAIAALGPHVQVARCVDPACPVAPSFVEVAREHVATTGYLRDFALAVGPDDHPVLTLNRDIAMRVLRCRDVDCAEGAVYNEVAQLSPRAALAYGSDGLPLIAFSSGSLYALACGDRSCASDSAYDEVAELEESLDDFSVALGADGVPVFAFHESANQDLWVARCADRTCQGPLSRRALGQSGEPLAFVTGFEGGHVTVFDTVTRLALTEIAVGVGPVGVAFSRDGRKAYITNLSSGTVSYIDVKSRTVERTVSLGAASQPRGIAVSPDHARLYVAASGSNAVVVVDRAAGTVLASVPVGAQPFGLALSPDGSTVVTANTAGHSASFVGTDGNTLLGTVPIGQQPYGIAIAPDGAVAYATNFASNTVSVLSMPARAVVGSIPAGLGPFGVAVSSDGARLYVSNNQNRVAIVDTATRTAIGNVDVGSHPQGVALTPDDRELYVANQFSDSVSVIDTNWQQVVDTLASPGAPVSLGAFVSPPFSDEAVEFLHANFDHYFVTSIPAEIQALDTAAFAGWARTGETFRVFPLGSQWQKVCRFFTVAFPPKSSHFYTPLANECEIVKTNPDWIYEGHVFEVRWIYDPTCPVGTTPLYRLYNNGQGGAPNHRYTTKTSIRDQMVAAGFVLEGVTGCVPR